MRACTRIRALPERQTRRRRRTRNAQGLLDRGGKGRVVLGGNRSLLMHTNIATGAEVFYLSSSAPLLRRRR